MDNYFFELPIYRCTEEKHLEELDLLKEKIRSDFGSSPSGTKKLVENLITQRYIRESYPHTYNEVIGWIQLFVLGNQLRGEYYYEVSLNDRNQLKKRINKGIRKKRFELIGKVFEISIYPSMKNDEISELLINELNQLTISDNIFKKRHIDLSKLEKISKFIDWQGLLKG